MYTGPHLIKDNLVFGYDTGYGVADNNTSTRFYPGEPTTNVLNDTILGTGNGASLGSDDFGTYIQLANQTTSYSRFQLPNISVSSNETYTWSFELYSEDTITQSGNYLFDTNEYSDQFPASNDLSRLSTSQDVPSTLPARVWTPFRLTVTMKDNLTGAYSYDFFNMYYPGFQNKKIYYRNMQFERNKSHKTPYVGQGGTRSATQSLIDLTKTTNIDVSNVSFDSTGQPTFDGTDDLIAVDPGTFPSSWSQPFTLEAIVYIPSSATWYNQGSGLGIVGRGSYTGSWGLMRGGGNNTVYLYIRTGSNTFNPGGTIGRDKYYHILGTWNGSNQAIFYINGNQNSQETNSSVGTTVDNTGNIVIGGNIAFGGSNGGYGEGTYPVVKLYNRALSPQEVQQNFRAYKNRFNL